jgi:hypothetical protein
MPIRTLEVRQWMLDLISAIVVQSPLSTVQSLFRGLFRFFGAARAF